MRSKYILIAVSVLVATAAVALVVSAGNPGTPPGPPETTSSYTLEAIFNRLVTGAAGMPSTFTEPISSPLVGTGHTLDEIMSVAPSVDDTNGAAQLQVLTGRTAWGLTSGGWGLMTGTMPDNSAVVITPATTNQTIATGYHDGSGYVEGDADLVASKIVSDTVIFGVVGTYPWGAVPKTGAGDIAGYTEEVGEDGHVNMRRRVAWPSPRFTDNGDGTVTDNLTALIWLKNANCPSARNWSTALSDVTQLNTDGTMNSNDCGDTSNSGSHQTDWRLPNVRELFSLIDLSDYNPALPSSPFTGVQSNKYWSSTTHVQSTFPEAWFVSLGNGLVAPDEKDYDYYVWPVRGGQ